MFQSRKIDKQLFEFLLTPQEDEKISSVYCCWPPAIHNNYNMVDNAVQQATHVNNNITVQQIFCFLSPFRRTL